MVACLRETTPSFAGQHYSVQKWNAKKVDFLSVLLKGSHRFTEVDQYSVPVIQQAIWNRDWLYEIMDFGTYMYVLVCT